MLPPQRHLLFGILFYLKIDFPSSRNFYRILWVWLVAAFLCPAFVSTAQTLHDPLITSTITKDQVLELGRLSQSLKDEHIVLDFEGLGNLEEIDDFYNGQIQQGNAGYDFGVSFNPGSLALINTAQGGSGNFLKKDLGATVLFSFKEKQIVINLDSGFKEMFSCYYTAVSPINCQVYDDRNGNGNLLASESFEPVYEATNDPDLIFTGWKKMKVEFSGVAMSVVLTGEANKCAYDDLVFGPGTEGKTQKDAADSDGNGNSEFLTLLKEPVTATEKGKIFLTGGSRFGVNVGKEKQKSGGSVVENSESTYYDLDFMFKGGYFFINNLVGGILIDLELYNNKPTDLSYGYKKGATFIAGPFARFYVPVNDKLVPFAEAQVGFGIDNSRSKYSTSGDWIQSDQSVFTYRLGGGATYFVNKMIGVDMFAGYQHDSYKYKDSGDSDSSSKYLHNLFTLQLGLVIVLDL